MSETPHRFAELTKRIFEVRGKSVMLDSDLAELYEVPTKVLNQAVKRNADRFPEDFIIRLSLEETRMAESLRSQFVTLDESSGSRGKHRKHRAFAFTEHGAVMLASVLRSPVAVKASVRIVRAFVQMRNLVSIHEELAERIKKLEESDKKQNKNFKVIGDLLKKVFQEEDQRSGSKRIGFIDPES